MPAHIFTLYAVWKCTHITTVDDFIEFSKVVNSGADDFSGTTVYLVSDLSLSGETLEPIGKNTRYYFSGTFDGQGHIISDLKINTSSVQYTGLFGYSRGLTIKNVVLDSSCSVTNRHIGSSSLYVGGIIGYCQSSNGKRNIENNVNMADVTFSGSINRYSLYLGGVIGCLHSSSSSSYDIYVKNCANYGSVTHSGNSGYSYIGGIVGYTSNSYYKYLYNCLNYGTITHSGTTSSTLHLGGIVGYSYYTHIENCVSAGEISSGGTVPTSYTGSIIGYVSSCTYINNCYFTFDVGTYKAFEGSFSKSNVTNTPNFSTGVNETLIANLNTYASSNEWNKWLLNKNNAYVTFKTNDNAGFTVDSQVILLPTIAVNNSDGSSFAFSGWYDDSYCQDLFQSDKILKDTTLYELYGVIVAVSFNSNGGNELTIKEKKVTLNNTYGTLPDSKKGGHMFVGWFTEKNNGTKVTNETTVTTPDNHTLYAHWEEVTTQVEVVFNTKNLTKEEVEKIIEQYTKADFTIAGYENESGEIRVIITFKDVEEAEEFVRNVNELSRSKNNLIKHVSFVSNGDGSPSVRLYPLLSFALIICTTWALN